MKRAKIDEEEEEEEEEIDYADVFGMDSEEAEEAAATIKTDGDILPISMATNIDCNLTRADYNDSQVINMFKQVCTVLALDLCVEHHETLRPSEFYFGETDISKDLAPMFHL